MKAGENIYFGFHLLRIQIYVNRAMAQWLRRWIPNSGVPCSKPLGGSKVDSAFSSFRGQLSEYQEYVGTNW